MVAQGVSARPSLRKKCTKWLVAKMVLSTSNFILVCGNDCNWRAKPPHHISAHTPWDCEGIWVHTKVLRKCGIMQNGHPVSCSFPSFRVLLMPSTTVRRLTQVYSFAEIQCPPLKTPQNGTVSNMNVVVETIVAFSCENGYELKGRPLLLCQESGTWNGMEPICTGALLKQIANFKNTLLAVLSKDQSNVTQKVWLRDLRPCAAS